MAICLPGMASRVKRAPTSAIRPAPLVITTKLITVRMMNTTRPTAVLPPTRKWPKASITLPAASGPVWPSSSTIRVEATLRDRRSSVVTSRMVGKTEKSSGFLVYIATSITITDTAMLKVNIRSSTNAGSGSTIIARMRMMSSGPASWRMLPGAKRVRRLRLPFMLPMVAHQGPGERAEERGKAGVIHGARRRRRGRRSSDTSGSGSACRPQADSS